MGQRQSSPQQTEEEQARASVRERVIRPSPRILVERTNPIQGSTLDNNSSESSASSIETENQRREQRRQRRAARRERLEREEERSAVTMANVTNVTHSSREGASAASVAATTETSTTTTTTTTGTGASNLSPFARMLAQVISEAVITSFRSGQIPLYNEQENSTRNMRQQLTMHLSPELFQQMEPDSDENSFMRFMRLPVIVSNVSNNNTNETTTTTTVVTGENEEPERSGDNEMTRILMLPVFLYGIRSSQHMGIGTIFNDNIEQPPQRRQSQRIRDRIQREREDGENTERGASSGQWTVYIISGNSVENIMSEHNPTYEELLDLASIVGPARRFTVSQELIDEHVPIVKYTQNVKQRIIGNSDGCQVCLSSYQSEEDLRILVCQHGFHKECIDKWLTEGQNQCPLCRKVPVPRSSL